MIRAVYLDASSASLLSQRKNRSPEVTECAAWLETLFYKNVRVYLPEITDYEIRRELIRAKKQKSIERLETMHIRCRFIPITSQGIARAAELWADARNRGIPTAEDCALDADVIFAAQVLESARENGYNEGEFIIATSNVRHISRYVASALWQEIIL